MKKLITFALIAQIVASSVAHADCDFSTGISELPDHSYKYTPECHLKVGQIVQDNSVKTAQLADLGAAIQLKDLALVKSDQRVAIWQQTSDSELERINKIQSGQKTNDFLYFGLGVLSSVMVGMMTARLIGR